jgi:asparagine synthase (glutamine-hydrolysing)
MCGIVGVFRPTRDADTDPWDDGRFDRMMRPIRSRGPDQDGRWRSDDGLVQFGHTRLSILDLSEAGRQPFHSASGRTSVTFNGEIYNFAALGRELSARGWAPRSTSDTEVLVEYIEAFGVNAFLNAADGMFAFGVYEHDTLTLSLARDRFGEKPLFWSLLDGCLLFGSDLRSFAAFSPHATVLNPGAVREYLHWGYVPETETIWLGSHKLRPGHVLRAKRTPSGLRVNVEQYFSARAEAVRIIEAGGGAPSDDALERVLLEAVSSRMTSDVPLGALLSGGIDSSLVVALMRARGRAVKTFAIGFETLEYNEAPWAARVAKHLGTEHRELYLSDEDVLSTVLELPGLLAEPLADSSLLPTFLVSRFAREHVTVALSGDGGDEMFGGYSRYARLGGIATSLKWVPRPCRRAAGGAVAWIAQPAFDGAFEAIGRVVPNGLAVSRPRHKLLKLARLLEETSLGSAYEALVMTGATSFVAPSRLGGMEPFSADWLASARMHDTKHYLPDDICVKVDRASMGVGLEMRAPFLAKAVFENAWRYPSGELMQGTRGKLPLRRVLSRHLPNELFERPKMGFGIPVHDWLRTSLADFVREGIRALHESGASELAGISEKGLRAIFESHVAGRESWGTELWSVAMLGAWLQQGQH